MSYADQVWYNSFSTSKLSYWESKILICLSRDLLFKWLNSVSDFLMLWVLMFTLNDIHTAHRVPSRNSSSISLKPIICKFVRRIAREDVMSHRREINQANPTAVGINNGDLSNADILDHLTPKAQELLFKAKIFKNR